jgi:hypothetical protein
MQNPHFVTIRNLEVIEMARFIRISNCGVTISRHGGQGFWKLGTGGWMLEEETVDTGHPRRVRLEYRTRNRRIFAIRKMEATENAAVIWVSNSRFAIRNAAR